MKKKICPYCDQAIQGLYCKGCRRVVLHPADWEVDYYLNERHPQNEENCSYHGELRTSDRVSAGSGSRSGTSRTGKISQAARNAARTAGAGTSGQSRTYGQSQTRSSVNPRLEPKKKQSSLARKLTLVIIIYVVIMFASTFVGLIAQFGHSGLGFSGLFGGGREPEPAIEAVEDAVEVDDWLEADFETDEWLVSEEEVKAAGERCTGYGHFGVTSEDMIPAMEGLMGVYLSDPTINSSNERYTYSSWYDTTYDYILENGDDYMGSLTVHFDTATGELHGMDLVVREAYIEEMANQMFHALASVNIAPSEPGGYELYRQVREKGTEDEWESYLVVRDGMEIYCDEFGSRETLCEIAVYAPGYFTTVEE